MVRSSLGRARVLLACAVGTAFGVSAVAMAAGDDRGATEVLLNEVASSPRREVAEPFAARSRTALDRAARLRSSGDEAHAKLADRVARSWAEAARDLTRAAAVERSASELRLAATDAGALADRERALLEEAIAQGGRLRAQLEAAEGQRNQQPTRTSTAAVTTSTKSTAKDGGAAPLRIPATPRAAADGGAR